MVRSRKRVSSGGAQENATKKKRQNEDALQNGTVFIELLTKNGFVIKTKNKPNETSKEQAVFQRDLERELKRHPDFPQILEEFTEGLSRVIEDPIRLRWCLCASVRPPDDDTGCAGGTQDSLMRVLLGIDDIQALVVTILLEKLAEFTSDEDNMVGEEKVNMPRLIMNQLRWLDRIAQPEELLEKVCEVLSVTPVSVQREVISALPEAVEDGQHAEVATRLKEVLQESEELCACILEALSSLTLEPAQVREAREWVIQSLPSAPLSQLPVTLKFLLHTVSSVEDAVEVVCEIRKNLDLKSTSQLSSANKLSRGDRSTEALIMDALKSAIRFQRTVAEAWIKCIDAVKIANEFKMLDICVLLILHATNYKKAVETLIRNKLRAGLLPEALIQNTLHPTHAQMLQEYSGSVLGLAEVLLRSPEPAVTAMACCVYTHAFVTFDTFARQEMVGALVTHIGSGVTAEVDCSLSILHDLVHAHTALMAPFTVFVKGVLDYLDNLSAGQIRKLYAMLSTLAFSPLVDESSMQDEMHIIIRKQLSNSKPKYKRMGVLGAIMVVKSLARPSGSSNDSSSVGEEAYKQVVDLLQLVTASCRRCPHTSALFMDELSSLIATAAMDSKVESWISDHVINCFQDDFIIDIEPQAESEMGGLAVELAYSLDKEEEGAIALHLIQLLTANHQAQPTQVSSRASPLCLAPTFRLLQICEKRQNEGSLEGVDALLGCALYTAHSASKDKLASLSGKEQQLYLDSLFLTVNWFREVINGFASQEAPEMKAKVITRLSHMTQLMQLLQAALPCVPKYTPMPACFDVDDVTKPSASTVTKKPKPKKSAAKRRRSDDVESDGDDDNSVHGDKSLRQIVETNTQDKQTDASTTEAASIDMSKYRPFFREFDVEVFSILQSQPISHTALDTEQNPLQQQQIQLQPPQLEFLLQDFLLKLQHKLPSTVKRNTFLKTKGDKTAGFSHLEEKTSGQIAKMAVGLLPALCDHLQGASAFFQNLIEENDGVLDGPGAHSPAARVMRDCLHLLLQCALTLFSWSGFALPENRCMLKEGLSVLSCRLDNTELSQPSLLQLVQESVRYLEKFGESVPDLGSAVTLCKLVACLVAKTENQPELQQHIGALSHGFLERDWRDGAGERVKGAKHNENIQDLLKLYIMGTDDVLAVLEQITTVAIPELIEADKQGCSTSLPTLTRNSFAVFYRCVLAELVSVVKAIAPGRKSDSAQLKIERLVRWNMAVKIFHALVSLVRVFDTRSILNAVMKMGRVFVETFLRQAMPLVDELFRSHKDDITGLLKNLQISTRALHHMCGHSKIVKDVSLTSQVPLVKRCLETFVYRVKACLSLNNCLEAFWLGNLKNRDLKGEEIVAVSQTTTQNDSTRADSDDNLPSDDSEEEEVTMDGDGNNTAEVEESYSEQF